MKGNLPVRTQRVFTGWILNMKTSIQEARASGLPFSSWRIRNILAFLLLAATIAHTAVAQSTAQMPWPKYVSASDTVGTAANGVPLPESARPTAQLVFEAINRIGAMELLDLHATPNMIGPREGVTGPAALRLRWRVTLPDTTITLVDETIAVGGSFDFPSYLCGIVCSPDPRVVQRNLLRSVIDNGGAAKLSEFFTNVDTNSEPYETLRRRVVITLAQGNQARNNHIDLDRYCKSHNLGASKNLDSSGYGWRCTTGNTGLDMQKVCREQYGQGYSAVLLTHPPGKSSDWRCWKPSS